MIASPKKETQDYPMIKNLEIKNFRGYENLKIEGLSRINIIVGANGSGKTALLEAIYLALTSDPAKYFSFRGWRGINDNAGIDVASLWNDLFYNSDIDRIIEINYTGSSSHEKTLKISFNPKAASPVLSGGQFSNFPVSIPITFEWRSGGDDDSLKTVNCVFGGQGLMRTGDTDYLQKVSFFTGIVSIEPTEVSKHFSQLNIQGKATEVIKSMKRIFPMILNLSVENPSGIPMVWANLKNVAGKRPLSFVSAGINKILSILLAVFIQSDGIVLIDEIENGLYYKTIASTWKELIRFSKQSNTQLFISTHSLEALQYLLPTLKENEKDFSLIKTKFEKGICSVTNIEGRFLEASLEGNMEVRD